MRNWRTDRVNKAVPVLVVILSLTAACTNPDTHTTPKGVDTTVPLVALDRACVTPAPQHPEFHLTVAQQSVSRSGIWRAYPGWTIPVAIDGSYQATLSIPTTNGYGYDSKTFKVKVESSAWRIAPGSEQYLPTPEYVGAPIKYGFVIVPTQPTGSPGTANSTPPSASMIRAVLEGVKTPEGKPILPFVMRVVDKQETMPACPDASIPNM